VTSAALAGQTVTLVVVTRDGRLLGAMEPFDVATPWWQEVALIVERVPRIAVLRMLEAERAPGHVMGGRVTYLVEPLDWIASSGGDNFGPLRGWGGTLTAHPLRMPWANPGGPASDLDWAADQVKIIGTPPAPQLEPVGDLVASYRQRSCLVEVRAAVFPSRTGRSRPSFRPASPPVGGDRCPSDALGRSPR
jgi:hypothetical protein